MSLISIAYFVNISTFWLTFRQSNDFQVTKSCIIISPAGEAQEQAYPIMHCIENASVMVQI